MPTNVIMPALGMDQQTGTLVRWLKREGERVEKGVPLMEIETDKALVEVESPASGILSQVTAQEDDEVPVGQVIALIIEADEAALGAPHAATRLASPRARRLAAERGVNLASVHGTGPEGAVLAADVLGAEVAADLVAADLMEAAAPSDLTPQSSPPSSRIWRVMAERMAVSWSAAPHFYLVREVVASGLVEMRARIAPSVEQRTGVKPTYTDLLVKLAAAALQKHPRVNAVSGEDGRRELTEVNIAVAIATEEALVAPVIRAADTLSVGEIALRRRELVERAEAGTLTPADLSGGTFTITNLGMYGVDAFNAILNPPQAAILAVGRIADRVVAVDGAPAVRQTLILTLSCDHRVVDGARAAPFLDDLASLIEEPWGLLA